MLVTTKELLDENGGFMADIALINQDQSVIGVVLPSEI